MKYFLRILFIISLFVRVTCFAQELIINEIVANNTSGYTNAAGKTPDWIELKNVSTKTINLSQFSLADSKTKSHPWQLPNVQLAPGAFYAIEATNPKELVVDWETIIDKGAVWKYIVPTTELPTQWKQLGFNDASWSQGPSGFGYGDNDDVTVLENCISVFIRKTFSIADVSIISSAILHMDYDDGFVAYLNGVEIARASIAGNPPSYNAGASGHEANWYQKLPIESFPIADITDIIQNGENVLCIQIHNTDINSSDMTAIPIFTLGYSEKKIGNTGVSTYIQLPQAGNQAPFKVSASKETIYLFKNTILADSIAFEDLPQDVSIGRARNETKSTVYFTSPTFGKENSVIVYTPKTLSKPVVSVAGGVYSKNQVIIIYSPDNNTQIYYTTDGSIPTENSKLYTAPISVSTSTILKYRAYKSGYVPSDVVTHSYIIFKRTHRLPIVSITYNHNDFFDPKTGIYVLGPNAQSDPPNFGANFWQDWERPCHVEVFHPDGTTVFSHNLGVKIAGNWSRANPQKSLKFYARDKYGDEAIEYQIFKDKPIYSFQSFILRNSGNDNCNTHMRDGAIQSLCRNMGIDYQAYQPAVVYMNGQYWGILNFREKINKDFITGNHGIPLESFAILANVDEPVYGDIQNFRDLYAFISNNDISIPANYERVKQDLDIDNYIKYNVIEMFAVNEDWPGNNVKAWREYGSQGKWRYILYDLDFGFGIWDANKVYRNMLTFALTNDESIGWPNPPWSTLMLRKLTQNQEFNALFLNHVADRLNTTFHPDSISRHIDSLKNLIINELSYHATRWNANSDDMYANILGMKEFGKNRGAIMRQHFEEYFNTGGSYPLTITSSHSNPGRIHVNTIDITKFPWSGLYFNNNTITLTAIPAPGYTFVTWQGAVVSTNPTITLTKNSATSVHAVFTYNAQNIPQIVISEINYNSNSESDTGDWIELYNKSNTNQDVSGWTITTQSPNKPFIFPQGSVIPANSYCIVSSSLLKYNTMYPLATYMRFGNIPFTLSKSQETLFLRNAQGYTIHSISYNDTYPYPKKCDGYGYTLECTDANNFVQNPMIWRAPTYMGTPGKTNTPLIRNVNYNAIQINEVMYNPHDNAKCGDWIELYNSGNSLVDISGWVLRDGNNSISIIPKPTAIAAKSYIVFCENPQKFATVYPQVTCTPLNIGFKSSGDFIRLADQYELVVDSVQYSVFSDLGIITNGTGRTIIRDANNTWTYGNVGGTPEANNIKGQTSLQEISHTTQYVYPNPCKSHIGISIDNAYMISIYTLLGQELMQIEVSDSTNIDISTLPAGMYIVQINTLNQVLYQLITKQ